ncbi:LytTR family DNA-binding domain-containing protein [Niabella sp.]|uniref:LytR/AlgR family response regulator transcription factor n=1 Tax=Niabella sp. TaxID=1962976 RepID=UPI00262714F8|nr:LytTR family DNA-binding domain-containing protein [Niabella sp.]
MSTALTAILVDDEPDSTALLELQLAKHCPGVSVLHSSNDPQQALPAILSLQPQLLFLDIEMPGLNGFQLLERLPYKPAVIFVTAYNQYAIRAFRYNALDYLVKPVLATDLVEAVDKAARHQSPSTTQLSQVQRQLLGEPVTKMAVSTQSGVIFINLKEIVCAEASGNYSVFILEDGSRFVVSKTLKEVQDLLEDGHFFRIHRQYIVNLNKVNHFDRIDFILTLDNKMQLPVARAQKDKLSERFKWL